MLHLTIYEGLFNSYLLAFPTNGEVGVWLFNGKAVSIARTTLRRHEDKLIPNTAYNILRLSEALGSAVPDGPQASGLVEILKKEIQDHLG